VVWRAEWGPEGSAQAMTSRSSGPHRGQVRSPGRDEPFRFLRREPSGPRAAENPGYRLGSGGSSLTSSVACVSDGVAGIVGTDGVVSAMLVSSILASG
jgi:hypothetical protein